MKESRRKLWEKIFSDGLVIQISFGLAAAAFFLLAFTILALALFGLLEVGNDLTIKHGVFAVLFLMIEPLLLYLSFLWGCVCFCNPNSYWAQKGLQTTPDSLYLSMTAVLLVFSLIAIILAAGLRCFGVKGHPIEYYSKLFFVR